MNIKDMDQNAWVCYRFGENSYYYGEVGLMDESGVVHSKDNAEMAGDPKAQLVKHGFGVYIYDDPSGQCRYEGYWEKGQKSGKGTLKMLDGSVYEGQFKEGCYHDIGSLRWANGDCYDGRWKKNRMDGPGNFKRHDGLNLKGSFKNNYFIDGNVLRNPFMPDNEYEKMKKARKELVKQYEKNQKIKNGYFERVDSENTVAILERVQKSVKNNRVALCVASEEAALNLGKMVEGFKEKGKQCSIVDLRKFYVANSEEKYNYIEEVSKMVQESMKNGNILIISLDQSEQVEKFEEFFYPEIKEIYTPNGLNNLIWAPQDLKRPEIKQKIIGEGQVHENFQVMVWSKVKLSQKISCDFLRQKLQKRFESVLPFIKVDLIFCEKNDAEKQQPKQDAE